MKTFKTKIFSFLLIALAGISTVSANFSDVCNQNENVDAINYVQSLGIIEGYANNHFFPDKPITRAEFTKILIKSNFSDENIQDCNMDYFTDVTANDWFYNYICVAKENNIVNGFENGKFEPNMLITFAEASKIIVNTLVAKTTEGLNEWYEPFVKTLVADKAIPQTVEDFTHKITRGEMAEVIYRLKQKIYNKISLSYSDL